MTKIIDIKRDAVTLGVVDRSLQIAPDLVQVTYADNNGTPHTVYSHKEGPFTSPQDVVLAHLQGTLHTFADHATAVAFLREQGDNTTADNIESYASVDDAHEHQDGGDE